MAESQPIIQSVSVLHAFGMARHKHVEGALDAARDLYERVVGAAPDHADAVTMLASIAYRQGRDDDGGALLDRAIGLACHAMQRKPEDSASRAAAVNLLLARGRIGEAEAAIEPLSVPLNPVRERPEEFAARRETAIAAGLPPIIITTLPKSASESIWNKLSDGLGLARCYLSLGLFPDCCLITQRVREAAKGGIAVKEHIAPTAHNLALLRQTGIDRIVVHHRDPLQATLSWVHFARDDINRRLMAPLWRRIVPPRAVLDSSLERQIDWSIDHYLPLLIDFLRDWRAVAQDPKSAMDALFMSFELFRTEPDAYFERVLAFYDIPRERFAFDAEAEVVHLRKGRIDEWREVFTAEQRRRAWSYIPEDLAAALGWEP